MRRLRALAASFVPSLAAAALVAFTLTSPATAQARIGIVLMHGKQGTPMGASYGRMPIGAGLIAALRNAGYLVATPEMCWSRQRDFDKPYPDCIAEVDGAIVQLKAQGATAIVVGGLSLGGNGAIAYGATHTGIIGVMAFAPADDPTRKSTRPDVAASLARAHQLMAQGQGDVKTSFGDVNAGTGGVFSITVATTPRIFLSFNNAGALTHIGANVGKLTVPILWVAGDGDPTQGSAAVVFHMAPPNPLNRFVTVHSNHLGTPDAALAWLAQLKKS